MKKQYEETTERRTRIIFITALIIVFTTILICGIGTGKTIVNYIISEAEAEEMEKECWILCQPDGVVYIRSKPTKNSSQVAWATCGIRMMTNGKERNGFLYVYNLAAEETSGWVSMKYVVDEEPKAIEELMTIRAEGRVACRKCMDGKIVKWFKEGDRVLVHWMADGWAVTDYGYIRYEYLEIE